MSSALILWLTPCVYFCEIWIPYIEGLPRVNKYLQLSNFINTFNTQMYNPYYCLWQNSWLNISRSVDVFCVCLHKNYLRNLALIHISINSYLGCIFRATIEILFDNQLFDFSDSITLGNKLFIETLFCANKWINEFLIFVLLIVSFAALLSAHLNCYPGVSLILLLIISN